MSDIRAQSRRDAEFDRLLDAHEQVNPAKSAYTDDAMREAYAMGKRHGREETLLSSIAPFKAADEVKP